MAYPALPVAAVDFQRLDSLFDKPGTDGLCQLKLPKGANANGGQSLDQILAGKKDAASKCVAMRCRMKTLITDRLTGVPSKREVMFQFRDASGQPANFTTAAFIRAIASKSCTVDLVDLLLSPGDQGFRMEPMKEFADETGECLKCGILTVRQGRLWFGGKETWVGERAAFLRKLQPQTFHYLLVPFVRAYWEPDQQMLEPSLHDHCFFVVICGLAPGVPRRLVYADPMALKPTWNDELGKDTFANYERANALHPSHHLGTHSTRVSVIDTMKELGEWQDVTVEDMPRNLLPINAYRDNGIAYSMCMAAAKLMRCPHHYLSSVPAAADGRKLEYDARKKKHPLRDLYEAEDYEREDESEHKAVSKSTLVGMEQLIRSAERGRRAPSIEEVKTYSHKTWDDFVQSAPGEDLINEYLYPEMGYLGWKAFRANEKAGRLDLLLYITFRERLRWDPQTGRFSA